MTETELIKQTGATFTPVGLAEFLAERILAHLDLKGSIDVLDPACGDGELLAAMSKALVESDRDFHVHGYDSNDEYLSIAKDRALGFGAISSSFITGDFLETVSPARNQLSLDFSEPSHPVGQSVSADVVIANPPYVRTQILGAEKAQELARKFNLTGRVDLYHPFLIAMTECLKEGGILGVITSNRYLTTKGGESIRQYLIDHYDLLEVIDLGDTKLFDAAVLPAILIGRKRAKGKGASPVPRFAKIYEESAEIKCGQTVKDVYDILRSVHSGRFDTGKRTYVKTQGILRYDERNGMPWEMFSEEEADWVTVIDSNSTWRVGDHFKVRVGIKTTADPVFISDSWDGLGEDAPETDLLRELISQENIEAWGVTDKVKLRVVYPHFNEKGKTRTIDLANYPRARRYFLLHEEKLRGRKYVIDAGREWFEIWVPQKPSLWANPKLVFPDISHTPRFCLDADGRIVNGNCYWISAESDADVDRLLLIQGIANSALMTRYHDLVFNNKLYSGRRRYLSQYVERYPMPDVSHESSKRIISIARLLNKETGRAVMSDLNKQLETAVSEAFGLIPCLNQD